MKFKPSAIWEYDLETVTRLLKHNEKVSAEVDKSMTRFRAEQQKIRDARKIHDNALKSTAVAPRIRLIEKRVRTLRRKVMWSCCIDRKYKNVWVLEG